MALLGCMLKKCKDRLAMASCFVSCAQPAFCFYKRVIVPKEKQTQSPTFNPAINASVPGCPRERRGFVRKEAGRTQALIHSGNIHSVSAKDDMSFE